MEIYLNGQLIQISEYLTFHQLFYQSGIPGDINNKFWQRNGSNLLVNQNTLVKDLLQPHDQLFLMDKPQKQSSGFNQQQFNCGNAFIASQTYQPNQGFPQQKNMFQQNQFPLNPQFGIQQGGTLSQVFIKQGSIDNKPPFQSLQTNQNPMQIPNQFQQNVIPQPQSNNYDVFQTVEESNQNDHDIFSTDYQYSNYETDRQNYLQNKKNQRGNKQYKYERDGYRFTLDNYGDDLIIEKLDQSFQIRLNNQFKLNKVRQFDIANKKKQFESNIILDLNCTRVSWIQDLDILAVQFNTGKIIAIQVYLE